MRKFFKQKGVKGITLIEVLIGGIILVVVGLLVSSIFLQGSMNIVTSWEETTALACMQELLEEVKGVAREHYRFIRVGASPTAPSQHAINHFHINIPTLVQTDTIVNFTVVAHDVDHNRTNSSEGPISITWTVEEGTASCHLLTSQIRLNQGIGSGSLIFRSSSSTPSRGTLGVVFNRERMPYPTGIIVYPKSGERIIEGDLIGTRTAIFELFNDPLPERDEQGRRIPDLLPQDYMRGTITFTWERKKGRGKHTKEIVTIIAPFPEP